MEIFEGGVTGWHWAAGSAGHDERGSFRGLVTSWPVFGLVAAHGAFWIDGDLSEQIVKVCEAIADQVQSTLDLAARLHDAIQRAPFPNDGEAFGGVEASLVMVGEDDVDIAQLGGAGVFSRSAGRATQLAKPKTMVHNLVAEGRLSAEQAAVHPQRGILTAGLFRGAEMSQEWDREVVPTEPGDQIIIVNLDLNWEIETEAIDLVTLPPSPRACAVALLKLASNNPTGATSNVIVLERMSQ